MRKGTFSTLEKLREASTIGIFGMMVLGVIHCGFLVFGYDLFLVHVFACVYALVLGIRLSRLFGMCFTHRCMVYYIFGVLMCIVMNRYGYFCGYVHEARVAMFTIGLILLFRIVWGTFFRKS